MDWWYLTDEEQTTYSTAFITNEALTDEVLNTYIPQTGLDKSSLLWIQLPNTSSWKIPDYRQYIKEELSPFLFSMGVTVTVVTDPKMLKALTKVTKVSNLEGYALETEYGDYRAFTAPSPRLLWLDPVKRNRALELASEGVSSWLNGSYVEPGSKIIKKATYIHNAINATNVLGQLSTCPELTVDIETFSLKHYDAGIKTIAFAWNQGEGVVIHVDSHPGNPNQQIREALRTFFCIYPGKLVYHNIAFDVTVLIYQLFMDHILDSEGLYEGLDNMLRNWECTKLISYLATNSCAGNNLSLKHLAQPFAGNYAQEDIVDVMKIPLQELMEYNLIDALSTWFVYDKYRPAMIQDNQLEIYENLFKPATRNVIQMQLTGMPIDMDAVLDLEQALSQDLEEQMQIIQSNDYVNDLIQILNQEWVDKYNTTRKVKRVSLADAKEEFNPGSYQQLAKLLFDLCGLPVLSKTMKGNPQTDADTLQALRNHTKDPKIIELLNALLDLASIRTILSTFIPAFKKAKLAPDGWHYLFGNLNLGGTVSGRMSSSDPNLQNAPSSSKLAAQIKQCVKAPPGWLFVGLDFNALEDRISALTTKDPNKLRIYTDGFDGHSFRAYYYFSDQMKDIDPESVESINSIADKYPELRQDSKAPTFSCLYGGTFRTMMKNLGWSEEKSKAVEANYHRMYEVSDRWVQSHLDQAAVDGFVTVAFGLRLRTPLLHRVVRKTRITPQAAEAEGRTAGNALGQSWGLLNNRAAIEFMDKVDQSQYKYNIRPSNHIHDAQYYLIKDDLDTLHWLNTHLVKAAQWQEDPSIAHPEVKLGGTLTIYFPTWADELKIPNNATPDEIEQIVHNYVNKD